MVNINDPNFSEEIRRLVEANAQEQEEDNDLYLLLLFFALLGARDAERQSTMNGDKELTSEQRANIDSYIEMYVRSRLSQLFGTDEPIPEELKANSLTNPELPQSLNATTLAVLTGIIVSNNGDAEKIREDLSKNAEKRAELIANQEAGRAMAVGMYISALTLGATKKTWLRTISKDPRDVHLKQVDVTVPFTSLFPDGSFWSNELINCKCGIKLEYGN